MILITELLRRFWPYIAVGTIAAGLGFNAAWTVQGLRLEAVENDFSQYKLEQAAARVAAEEVANRQREETANEYRKLKEKLSAADAFARCVAAGRCGGLSVQAGGASVKLPPAGRTVGAGPDPIPTTAGPAEEAPGVIADCTVTTLMLNTLQADIEKQAK